MIITSNLFILAANNSSWQWHNLFYNLTEVLAIILLCMHLTHQPHQSYPTALEWKCAMGWQFFHHRTSAACRFISNGFAVTAGSFVSFLLYAFLPHLYFLVFCIECIECALTKQNVFFITDKYSILFITFLGVCWVGKIWLPSCTSVSGKVPVSVQFVWPSVASSGDSGLSSGYGGEMESVSSFSS